MDKGLIVLFGVFCIMKTWRRASWYAMIGVIARLFSWQKSANYSKKKFTILALTVKDSKLKCSQHKKFNSENCYQTSRLFQMVKYIFYNGQSDTQVPRGWSTPRNRAGGFVAFLGSGHIWRTCPNAFWPQGMTCLVYHICKIQFILCKKLIIHVN